MDTPRVIFFGTPDYVLPIVKMLDSHKWLVGIVTTADKPVGRKQIVTPSPVSQYQPAPTIIKTEDFTPEIIQKIKDLKPNLFVVASYGKIIPQEVLEIPEFGALNIHPSLLPKYRGASPIQAAILNGDQISGITIIKMDDQMDHGPILVQEEFAIPEQATFEDCIYKMFGQSAQLLEGILPDYLQGDLKLTPQDNSQATYTWKTKETKQKAYFDITNPPSKEELHNIIKAFYPWPAAWTEWNGKIVKLYPKGLVQIEGKSPVSLKDFLNGYSDFPIKEI